MLESDPNAIGIKVCIANYNLVKDSRWLLPAVYKMLDTLLGEKSFALDIEYVSVDELQDEPERNDLIELSGLRDYVEWKKSRNATIGEGR